VHRDNDEERLVRVDAILQTLWARKNARRKTLLRWKTAGSRKRVAKRG
jgi:hypothetical protein